MKHKMKFLVQCRSRPDVHHNFIMEAVRPQELQKVLGVTYDLELTFKMHQASRQKGLEETDVLEENVLLAGQESEGVAVQGPDMHLDGVHAPHLEQGGTGDLPLLDRCSNEPMRSLTIT